MRRNRKPRGESAVANKGHNHFFRRNLINNLRSQLTNLRSQLINLRSQLNNWRSQLTNLQSFKVTKMAGRFVFVCFIVLTLPSSYYTLPNYLPTLRHGNQERNSLIEEYFHLGFNYSEMLSFLLLYHGVRLSLRQLERILRSRGLRRRKIQSGINRVVNAIDQELQSSGSCIGYRQMHQRLLKDHGIVIDRETVRRKVKETRKKQVTHSNTNPAICSTLRMRTAISPWQWQPWTGFVLVRTHQHGIAPGQFSLTITDPAFYCQEECTSTPLSASSTQHMW